MSKKDNTLYCKNRQEKKQVSNNNIIIRGIYLFEKDVVNTIVGLLYFSSASAMLKLLKFTQWKPFTINTSEQSAYV